MLVCLALLVVSLPLHIPVLLLPCFITMVVCAFIVLFRRRDPERGLAPTILLRVVAGGLLAGAAAVGWFVYQFVVHPPTD
jgi:hypothetical protein